MAFESNPFQRKALPDVVKNLLIINVICFLITYTYGEQLLDLFGLHYFLSPKFKIFQVITYMFLHGGFGHIFFNMFALWMFGSVMENEWGAKRFLTYYVVCGIGAAIVQNVAWHFALQPTLSEINNPDNALQYTAEALSKARIEALNAPLAIGASGAIFGILLAYGMTFPNNRLFIIPFPFPIKAKYAVALYGILELTQGIRIVNIPGDNVAHFAHLGGLVFGFFLIMYWRMEDRNRRRDHFDDWKGY